MIAQLVDLGRAIRFFIIDDIEAGVHTDCLTEMGTGLAVVVTLAKGIIGYRFARAAGSESSLGTNLYSSRRGESGANIDLCLD